MARPPQSREPVRVLRDDPNDRIEERPPAEAQALPWTTVLVWFMRALALLWIVKGLFAWGAILGVSSPSGFFETRSTGYQATTIYFAVIDLIAAVGLWMASTWGGVLWLLALMSHMILAWFFPRIVTGGTMTMLFFCGLIAAYLVLSWLSAREEQ